MRLEFTVNLELENNLNLMQLIPEKFHNSPVLKDYVPIFSQTVADWLIDIKELLDILDPNTVRFEYLRYIAHILGLEFVTADASLEDSIRREIVGAVDWYKLKGTYGALTLLAKLINYEANLWDLYTNDYEAFSIADWWTGDEDENPPGFDSSYYKSPHFYFEVLLDKVFSRDESGADEPYYLWEFGQFDELERYIELLRPVNTVPHYRLKQVIDFNDGDIDIIVVSSSSYYGSGDEVIVVTWDGGVACLYIDWESGIYFDEGNTYGRNPKFDGTYNFNQYSSSMLENLTSYSIGIGNRKTSVEDMQTELLEIPFTLETPVFTESVASYTKIDGESRGALYVYKYYNSLGTLIAEGLDFEDRFQFDLILPATTTDYSLTEGAIYINSAVAIGFLFYPIEKDAEVEQVFSFSLSKTLLSLSAISGD
jgi:hypothetical protein